MNIEEKVIIFETGVGKGSEYNGDVSGTDTVKYVAVGNGEGTKNIYWSVDGLDWTSVEGPFGSGEGRGIKWNGSLWIAVGKDSGGTNNIYYSDDGKNWVASNSYIFNTGSGIGITWDDKQWIAMQCCVSS